MVRIRWKHQDNTPETSIDLMKAWARKWRISSPKSCFFRIEAGRRSRGINSRAHEACMRWPGSPSPPTNTFFPLGGRARTILHAVPDRAECICSLLARPIVILLLAARRCGKTAVSHIVSRRARKASPSVFGRRTASQLRYMYC